MFVRPFDRAVNDDGARGQKVRTENFSLRGCLTLDHSLDRGEVSQNRRLVVDRTGGRADPSKEAFT
jgi:hypothetical protein